MTAPDGTAVARFRADVEAVLGEALAPDARLALAVSGGADSMAMLVLAHAAFPDRVLAATVDHGLRAESADEAAMVARWCTAAGVPHVTLRVAAPPGPGDNLQAWARAQRYALLGAWAREAGAWPVATAHHADDQAETFLMRAARGSGLSGLAGIRPREKIAGTAVLRPLLGWRRAEFRAVIAATGTPFVEDSSNADARFDRVRVRNWLADAPLDAGQIARAAAQLGALDADLAAWCDALWVERAAVEAEMVRIDMAGLPREARRRLTRCALATVAAEADRAANLEALLDALDRGGSATQGAVLGEARGAMWHFRAAPPRRS